MALADFDRQMMVRAIELARQGIGRVSPNPLVGCVIVDREGSVIGEGAHLEFGGPHAEPNAIADAEGRGKSVQGATVYVTLEPHSHEGKTRPCSELLISKKIARCVVAMQDPYAEVNGAGIRNMRHAGIEVEVGCLEAEARDLARFFVKHVTTGLPYITLKIATSLDGRSALANGESQWITSESSRKIVHHMRAEHDAVLVGTRTALLDDPQLTVRHTKGRQPWRVVLDPVLLLPERLHLFTDEYRSRTIVVAIQKQDEEKRKRLEAQGVEVFVCRGDRDRINLEALLKNLAGRGIASVLAEAGPTLATSMLRDEQFDEIALFYGPILMGGDARPIFAKLGYTQMGRVPRFDVRSVERIGSQDFMVRLRKLEEIA
jgi:diaminohydroxyphosphoribosylaminopyrimidine deaminase/5-amino-6-(5-phosphoribosylamino)uracil reductase